MIVQPRDGQLLLIRQTDHAALSGVLAEHWGNDRFARPEPRASVVTAAIRHDEGWRAWEAAPRLDPATRRPCQFFQVPVPEHYAFYRLGLEAVLQDDLYAGLLVNMHLAGLYKKRYGLDPDLSLERYPPDLRPVVEGYIEQLEAEQRQIRARLRHDSSYPADTVEDLGVWTNYKLLQVFDLCSLYLCMTPPQERVVPHVPVNLDYPDQDMTLSPLGGTTLKVSPYPFDIPSVHVSVPATVVPDREYADDEDLQRAMARAPVMTLAFELVRTP